MLEVETNLNLGDAAYRAIIRMILENKYRPGDVLLESELAERLSFSRTPVSYALGKLVAEGFLEKRKKKGCVIPIPSAEDAKNVFLARQVVESQTAAAAAQYGTAEEIAELALTFEKQDLSLSSGSKELFSSSNEAFHLGIAMMSKNPYFERYCRHAFWHSNTYIFFFDRFYRNWAEVSAHSKTAAYHKRIYDAIARHDASEAGRLMGEHILTTYEGLLVRIP
ncbi:MAG: GntR family transcriptional regulator [Holophaga sp.]|nr:GntR family transcriptional regulator [Holophaga sp.]